MKEKRLDIAHYLANAIVSDPAILKDESYLRSIPKRVGISGRDRVAFDRLVNAAVRAAAPLTDLSPGTISKALQQSRSTYARDLNSAMRWAMRNADIVQDTAESAASKSRQQAIVDYSEDTALDVFLGKSA